MEPAKGYTPITKLETNIMASPNMLRDLNFDALEIDKVVAVLKTRKQLLKRPGFLITLFHRKNEVDMLDPLICDVCRKFVYLTAEVPPPGVAIDYHRNKVYVVCGFCQFRLGLSDTESGVLFNAIKDGYGYIDVDRIETMSMEPQEKGGEYE